MADWDFSEFDDLADDLVDSIDRVMDVAVSVTKRGAQNIKRAAVERVEARLSGPGKTHLPHYPRSIDYEIEENGLEVTAEIGPNSAKRQGGRGLGVEFGSVNAPPIPHVFPAFDEEKPRYIQELTRRVGEVIF